MNQRLGLEQRWVLGSNFLWALLRASRPSWPFPHLLLANGGYQGLARRRMVERFSAWLDYNQPLVKDVQPTIASWETPAWQTRENNRGYRTAVAALVGQFSSSERR